jgi:hypothetical protein
MSWISEKLTQLQDAISGILPDVPGHSHDGCSHSTSTDFNSLKVAELKTIAKEKGLTGYTSLRKAQLIELLEQN